VGVYDAGDITLGYPSCIFYKLWELGIKNFFSLQWSNQSLRKFSCCAC